MSLVPDFSRVAWCRLLPTRWLARPRPCYARPMTELTLEARRLHITSELFEAGLRAEIQRDIDLTAAVRDTTA